MIFQIEEMLRAEHITDETRIAEEIAVYNSLVPEPGQLSATLFIEIIWGVQGSRSSDGEAITRRNEFAKARSSGPGQSASTGKDGALFSARRSSSPRGRPPQHDRPGTRAATLRSAIFSFFFWKCALGH